MFPDWKKIGKNIGRRLRDSIPAPPESGPSREGRRDQRLKDVFKGFAYFDDFDELAAWCSHDVDPLQRANVPLLQRTRAIVNQDGEPRSSVLLCHDYKGGYHEYEGVRPPLVEQPLYRCNYLQYVDVFVYFSHKLLCCPPPTWTNTLHRNGVKVLGTFIVEPATTSIERVLEAEQGRYVVAEQLARMADTFAFDGWFLNFEKSLSIFTHNPIERLLTFTRVLRTLLGPDKLLIWYDGLTDENEVDYQNGLSEHNVRFAKAAGSLFTNYEWDETKLNNASIVAEWHHLDQKNVFFGIDVWAQNTDLPGPKRITYPREGGGGTLTGLAVNKLADRGFSAAVFAPAWTYEHFPHNAASHVDQALWEGSTLPEALDCDCREGRPHHQQGYQEYPIIRASRESAAGTDCFFESDFRCSFEVLNSDPTLCSRLGEMQPQPRVECSSTGSWTDLANMVAPKLSGRFVVDRCSSNFDLLGQRHSHYQVALECECQHTGSEYLLLRDTLRFQLFTLDMPVDAAVSAKFTCGRTTRSATEMGCFLAYRLPGGEVRYQDAAISFGMLAETITIPVGVMPWEAVMSEQTKLIGAGVYCAPLSKDEQPSTRPVLDLYHLSIAYEYQVDRIGSIHDIRLICRSSGNHSQNRIAWEWSFPQAQWARGRPWSQLTGPYEKFEVSFDGQKLGTSSSTEFPIQDTDLDQQDAAKDVQVTVRGKVFGELQAQTVGTGQITFVDGKRTD